MALYADKVLFASRSILLGILAEVMCICVKCWRVICREHLLKLVNYITTSASTLLKLSLSPSIICRLATAEESSRVNSALHGYQQQVLDHILLNPEQNYIIVAPTASGKTRIPLEVAGALLRRRPTAKILFLSPTVALTEQVSMPTAF